MRLSLTERVLNELNAQTWALAYRPELSESALFCAIEEPRSFSRRKAGPRGKRFWHISWEGYELVRVIPTFGLPLRRRRRFVHADTLRLSTTQPAPCLISVTERQQKDTGTAARRCSAYCSTAAPFIVHPSPVTAVGAARR